MTDPIFILKIIDASLDWNQTYNEEIEKLKKYLPWNPKIDYSSILREIFLDYRTDGTSYSGNRLSKSGNLILSNFFKSYEFKFVRPIPITNKHILFLCKFCKRPFYVDRKKIIFYEQDLAVMYRLSSDNLDDFCEAYDDYKL